MSSLNFSTILEHHAMSVLVNSKKILVHGSGRTIAGVGLEDLIIFDNHDVMLIVRKGHAGTGH